MDDWLNNNLTSFASNRTWKSQCAGQLLQAWLNDPNMTSNHVGDGFVNQAGAPTNDPSQIWGINMPTCEQYCSYDKLGTVRGPRLQ